MNPDWSPSKKLVLGLLGFVLTAAVLTAWGIFIRPYTDGAVKWSDATFGNRGTLIIILAVMVAGGLYSWLSDRDGWRQAFADDQKLPLWRRVIGYGFWILIFGGVGTLLLIGIYHG